MREAGYETDSAPPAPLPTLSKDYTPVRWFQRGIASVYGRKFYGRLTANGEIFNPRSMTAAHRLLRFGTVVRVTRVSNGRSVEVRINDRGPYHGDRVIDLSTEAARRLGMDIKGVMQVTLEVVSQPAVSKRRK